MPRPVSAMHPLRELVSQGAVEKGAVSVHRGRTCALPPTGASYESQDAALNQWWGRCPPLVPSHLHELLSRFPLFRSTNFPHHSMPPPSLISASPLFPLHFAAYTFFSIRFFHPFELPSFLIIFFQFIFFFFRYVFVIEFVVGRNGQIAFNIIFLDRDLNKT